MKPDYIDPPPASQSGSPTLASTSNSAKPAMAEQTRLLLVLTACLGLCFAFPLLDLARFAIHSDLFSHVLLVPVISLYLVRLNKGVLPAPSKPVRVWALIPFVAGSSALLGLWLASRSGSLPKADYLAYTTSAFVLFFAGICFLALGPNTLRSVVFPLGFLVFLIPFPTAMTEWVEAFLQHASAYASDWLFTVVGMTFFRNGLAFQLPGIQIHVAPECSGIHSTLVLFITSFVAGKLFLESNWKRAVLVLAVVPLGILRNAVRIVTIGELCVHISPSMIDSPIHHKGGPLFFAVSLVPLFLLLYFLRRSERRSKPMSNETHLS